jgi:hypothetical protein
MGRKNLHLKRRMFTEISGVFAQNGGGVWVGVL